MPPSSSHAPHTGPHTRIALQSMLDALRNHVTGRAHIKANLKNYRYFDNVGVCRDSRCNWLRSSVGR